VARDRSWLQRMNWHPLVAALPFGFFVFRVFTAGFTATRTIGLCVVTLWFAMAVIDRATGHRLTDWLRREDED
jgi:hypothetical protein